MDGATLMQRAFPLLNEGKCSFSGFMPLLSAANKQRLVILPNIFVRKLLEGFENAGDCAGGSGGPFPEGWPKSVRASPFVIFTRPDVSFREANPKDNGRYVIYEDEKRGCTYRFEVPKGMEGMKNTALLIPHGFNGGKPIIEVEKEKGGAFTLQAQEGYVVAFENFPQKSGEYQIEDAYGLPHAEMCLKANGNARYLLREKEYFDFMVRGIYYKDCRKIVYLNGKPSEESGALVTSSDLFLDGLIRKVKEALDAADGTVPDEFRKLVERLISAAMQ